MAKTQKSQIGLIGLATMGENFARNIADKGFRISVFNRTTEKTQKFIEKFYKKNSLFTGAYDIKNFISNLETPRKIILLVKADEAVDAVIQELKPFLSKGDILIDCGNSHFKDTERRQIELEKNNLNFIGCGISGGEEGALKGPSLMPGGNKKAWQKIHKIFEKIAARDFSNKPCTTYIGPNGSGHFVKMVHNGIEYAIMQLIAESYDILKNIGKFSNPELAKIFNNYGKTENLKSFLLEITAKIFTKKDPFKNSKYLIEFIKDSAGQKDTGKWTTEIAHELDVAIPTINAAVDARIISGDTKGREMRKTLKLNTINKRPNKLEQKNLIKLVGDSLEFSTILCYEQGIELLTKAGKEFNWNLDLKEITRIWQGGCIIRSNYLKNLTVSLGKDKKAATKIFKKTMKLFAGEKQKNWRTLMCLAIENTISIPAFYTTLSYYDSYTKTHLPQNLIQAQRDFFGAHGYERIDKPGSFHTEWN